MLVKLAVLFSGNGSNLENILEKLHKKTIGENTYEVVLCICNKKMLLVYKEQKNLVLILSLLIIRLIILVKNLIRFWYKNQRKWSKSYCISRFYENFKSCFYKNIKAINLHPSLLPLFKGAHAIKESYESDMKVAGVSVHWVSEELDGGMIIAQKAFEKRNLSFEEFEEKIHSLEHEILPLSVIEIFS